MSKILHIDTAVQSASICISSGEEVLSLKINLDQKEQASWLQPAIRESLLEAGLSLSGLSAIAISAGPGSYTGLRVGMASAKGLCYVLNLPLITLNTLRIMASGARKEQADLLCPMIDARRMEVFTALYSRELEEIRAPGNLILDENSLHEYLETQKVLFFGNGSLKFRDLVNHPNALFKDLDINAQHMIPMANAKFEKKDFADLAYSEPFYGKDFHSTVK